MELRYVMRPPTHDVVYPLIPGEAGCAHTYLLVQAPAHP